MSFKQEWKNRVCQNMKRCPTGFRDWLETKDYDAAFFDHMLYKRTFLIQKSLLDDYDHFTCITGLEGMGKSTLAIQYCSMVSPRFSLKHICYDMVDLIEAMRTAQPGDSLLLDEGGMFLFSREAMMDTNRQLVKLFMIARQRNVHICVCIPNFFTIDTYLREHRVKTLIDVFKRGHYRLYIKEAIKYVSVYGKKFKNASSVKVPAEYMHNGHFNKPIPLHNDISDSQYREFKAKHFEKFITQMKDTFSQIENSKKYVSVSQYIKKYPMKRDTVLRNLKKGLIKGKQIGNKWYISPEML